jgi:glycosylphosphatidylinositol deacylase
LITKTLPFVLITLSFLAISLSFAKSEQENGIPSPFSWQKSSPEQSSATMEFDKNDLLVGLSDPFFWFLAPLFALLAVGVCVVLNYVLMIILHTLAFIYSMFSRWPNWVSNERRCGFLRLNHRQMLTLK